jgi:hypothetical protein
MSTLAIVVDQSKLRTKVSNNNHTFICQLKVSCVTFNEHYLNGTPLSVASMIHRKKNLVHNISKKQHQTSNPNPSPKKKKKHVSAEEEHQQVKLQPRHAA